MDYCSLQVAWTKSVGIRHWNGFQTLGKTCFRYPVSHKICSHWSLDKLVAHKFGAHQTFLKRLGQLGFRAISLGRDKKGNKRR